MNRRGFRGACIGVLLLGHVACGGSWATAVLPAGGTPRGVGSFEGMDAKRALEQARAKKAKLEGTRGAQLERLRAQAVVAYQRVARRYPTSGAIAAEASFRAGELLRAGDEDEAAIEELQRAVETANGGEFRPRARYELAHIFRRTKRFESALEHFAQVETDRVATDHQRDLAALWKAKTFLEMGNPEEAERTLRVLVTRATDPVDRVRAYDELILRLAETGRLAAAVGHFAAVKRTSLRVSLERTERGERVRSALERMRCLAVMQRAIAASR